MTHPARAAALAALLLVSPARVHAQRDVPYTYQGTVHAVQLKTQTLDVIIGVGYALRVVRMRATPGTSITGEGSELGLRDLAPGDVVRADCRRTDAGLVVDKIEITQRGP